MMTSLCLYPLVPNPLYMYYCSNSLQLVTFSHTFTSNLQCFRSILFCMSLYLSSQIISLDNKLLSLLEVVTKKFRIHAEAWSKKVFIDIRSTIKVRYH